MLMSHGTDRKSIRCFGLNDVGQLGLGHQDTIGDERGEMGCSLQAVEFGD